MSNMKAKLLLFGALGASALGLFGASVRFTPSGALVIEGDQENMNWILRTDGSQYAPVTEKYAWAKVNGIENSALQVRHEREEAGEDLIERVIITNTGDKAAQLEGASINFPFNDNYTTSHECVVRRCNAHLWPFGSGAWVCCIRMGGAAPHLGWMLTRGEVDGYTISERGDETDRSNFRGVIAFRLPSLSLAPGEEYSLEWRLFSHNGGEDFIRALTSRGGVYFSAAKFVGEMGEKIDIFATAGASLARERIAEIALDTPGEKIIPVEYGGKTSRVELLAISNYRAFIERRLDFILARQQYSNPADPRDGAFLPFDNETDAQYCDWLQEHHRYDLDEGRERIGMGIAIAEAIRDHGYANSAALPALRKYARFIRSALQSPDYKTRSEVLRADRNRIYNYAWVARFYFDMYDITREEQYLEDAYQTARATFRFGGHKFYLIDMPVRQSIVALRSAGRSSDAAALLADYRALAENFMAYGLEVPKSEVNFEQSIIAPAANFLCEMYLVTKDEKYKRGVEELLPAVEAFNGFQPSWHLNDIAIRHWDGYWFGKRMSYGDTFPHYWSAITADFFGNWSEATGSKEYRERASRITAANLGLITEAGRAGAAWIYPSAVNSRPARFLEPMANDQDWAIAFASRWLKPWPPQQPSATSSNN